MKFLLTIPGGVDGANETVLKEDIFTFEHDDKEVVEDLFNAIDTNHNKTISRTELQDALSKYQDHEELVVVLKKLIEDQPYGDEINFDRFFETFQNLPRVRGERVRWSQTLGLEGLLARFLKKGSVFDGLSGLKHLQGDELNRHIDEVCRHFSERLPQMLRAGITRLQADANGASEAEQMMNSKFSMDGAYLGRFASLDEFYEGPESLIGVPNPKIWEGAEKEHKFRRNSGRKFTTTNYALETWPALEWEFVVEPGDSSKYPHTPADKTQWETTHCDGPHKDQWKLWKGPAGRDVRRLDDFLRQIQAEMARAGLLKVEAVCLCLYTGPMFMLYNASLRGFPNEDVEALEGNKFETTIFTIASGITKLSKVSDIPPGRLLFRGLGGMILPEQFWREIAECVATVHVSAAAGEARSVAEAIAGKITESEEGVLKCSLKTRVLRLGQDAGYGAMPVRVVSEARNEGDTVHITVALPLSKVNFTKEAQGKFKEDIKSLCGASALEVHLEKIADKPKDFKGGGTRFQIVLVSRRNLRPKLEFSV